MANVSDSESHHSGLAEHYITPKKNKKLKNDDKKENNAKMQLTQIFQKFLDKLPKEKRELARDFTKKKDFYFGDTTAEIEKRLNDHDALDLFAVTAKIDPATQFHRQSVISRNDYPFPCRNSKKADCSRVVCISCKMHVYLYHKYEQMYQFPCQHFLCNECVHTFFQNCYNKYTYWPLEMQKASESYIADMLQKKKIDKKAAFALPRLVSARCIADTCDKTSCSAFIFCPCNNKVCKEILEFVNPINRETTKFPKRIVGFTVRSRDIFEDYYSHYQNWNRSPEICLTPHNGNRERQHSVETTSSYSCSSDQEKESNTESSACDEEVTNSEGSRKEKIKNYRKTKKRKRLDMESNDHSTPTLKKKKVDSTIEALLTLQKKMETKMDRIDEVIIKMNQMLHQQSLRDERQSQHLQEIQQIQQVASNLINFVVSGRTRFQIIKNINIETNGVKAVFDTTERQ